MATFEIVTPDGKRYRVTGENMEGALEALKTHVGSSSFEDDDNTAEIATHGAQAAEPAQWSLEQQKALALARGRRRGQENSGAPWEKYQKQATGPWTKYQKQEPRTEDDGDLVGTIDAYGRGIAKGATLGFADEIGAAARWAGGKVLPWQKEVTYEEALDEVRGSDRGAADAHPVADIAGNLTGALGLGTGLVKAGLSPTARAINGGSGLSKVSLASALEGSALGTIQGFGDGEGGPENRAENGAYGAAGGAVIGGAIPVVGSLARRAISPFLSNPERTRAAAELANTPPR